MASKFIVFIACVAVASAGLLEAPAVYSAGPSAYAPNVVKYSSAPAVSHSYSISAPGPITYAAPALKTVSGYAAPVVAAYHSPAIGATHQNVNVVRSFDGTVSHYAKAVDTAFSSVRKVDTRINNNVYAPALAKTIAYPYPAPTVYSAPAPVYARSLPTAVYSHAPAPTVYSAAPAVLSHSAPVVSHVSFNGLGVQYGW